MNDDPVGFIGLGNMGGNMVRRLLDRGARVVAFDVDPDRRSALCAEGAWIAASARDVADRCPIVISCLPSKQASLDTAGDERGVIHGQAVRIYIEMSTLGRATVESIADLMKATGIGFLDVPVSGGVPRARAGTLALLASGPQECLDAARPVLDLLGSPLFHLGPEPGMSQVVKLINNHVSAAGRLAVFEGLAMGIKAGVDPKVLNDVFNASTGMNYTTMHKVPAAILSGTFKYNGSLRTGLKDQSLLLEEAQHFNAAFWLAPRILAFYREAADAGYRDRDGMALLEYVQSREQGSVQ